MPNLRRLLAAEVVAFASASAIHSGLLVDWSPARGASIAEGIIAIVLLIGWLVAAMRPAWTRPAAALVQAFGLLGSLVGLVITVRGAGPATTADLVFHLAVVVTLAVGVWLSVRTSRARAIEP